MAFPSSPSNGDIATVANVIYSYNSTKNAWIRLRSDGTYLTVNTLAVTGANVSTSQLFGALIVAGGVGIGGNLHAGTIQGTVIGNTTPSTGKFTTLESVGNLTISAGNLVVTNGNINAVETTLTGNLNSGNVRTGIISATNNITTSANVNSSYVTATNRVSANNVNNTGQFYYNTRTISANVTIAATENAMSVGPMTIADGVEVVIADGGEWSIV